MKKFLLIALTAGLLLPAAAFAAQKTYQVTGKVVEVSDAVIIVDKDGEKFEMARDAKTTVTGDLKVGAKVTVQYAIKAVDVEVKADKAPKAEKKK